MCYLNRLTCIFKPIHHFSFAGFQDAAKLAEEAVVCLMTFEKNVQGQTVRGTCSRVSMTGQVSTRTVRIHRARTQRTKLTNVYQKRCKRVLSRRRMMGGAQSYREVFRGWHSLVHTIHVDCAPHGIGCAVLDLDCVCFFEGQERVG